MHRRLQFGMRENPASDRRHGSRQAVSGGSNENYTTQDIQALVRSQDHLSPSRRDSSNAASDHAATAGESDNAAQHSAFEPLIDSCEATRLLGNIHVKTLQRYACCRRIPGYQIGGHWYFRASELDCWLRSRLNSNCQPADRVDLIQEEIP